MSIGRTPPSGAQGDGTASPDDVHAALQRCRALVRETGPDGLDRDTVQAAVRQLAVAARRDEWPPERLLISLKDTLGSAPVSIRRTPEATAEAHARLVQLAIRAYYAEPE